MLLSCAHGWLGISYDKFTGPLGIVLDTPLGISYAKFTGPYNLQHHVHACRLCVCVWSHRVSISPASTGVRQLQPWRHVISP